MESLVFRTQMGHKHEVHVAEGSKSFDEELIDCSDTPFLLSCSPHGGMIEKKTAEQTILLEDLIENSSAWFCRGFKDGAGANKEFHVTSTKLHKESLRFLPELCEKEFNYAVSFHGYTQDGIKIGGGASRQLKYGMKEYIDDFVDCSVEVVFEGRYAGTDEMNFINRVSDNGIQLEQSKEIREDSWRTIVRAVQLFFEDISPRR